MKLLIFPCRRLEVSDMSANIIGHPQRSLDFPDFKLLGFPSVWAKRAVFNDQ